LTVFRGQDSIQRTELDYIRVLPAVGNTTFFIEDFQYEPTTKSQLFLSQEITPANWQTHPSAGFNSTQSYWFNNFDDSVETAYSFESRTIDASDWTELAIKFDWAYAARYATGNLENLRFSISNDCGETWSMRKSYNSTSSLRTVADIRTTAFVPVSNDEWKTDIITNIPASYLTENFRFKVEFTANKGNNLFIDNIQVGPPNQLNSLNVVVDEVKVYPNPAEDVLIISAENGLSIRSLTVFAMDGKKILSHQLESIQNEIKWDVSKLDAGWYWIEVETPIGMQRIKQVIK
jgi:hypothetical protein